MVGGKANNLNKLTKFGFNVPDFFIIEDMTNLSLNLNAKSYAVRSSANVEDQEDKSYAGLFETYLDVKAEDVPLKVSKVFNSKNISKNYETNKEIKMNVIVQEFIKADISGICFTNMKNRMVISLHAGDCEDLVSGKVAGEEVTVDRETFCFHRKPKIDINYTNLIKTFLQIEKLFKKAQDIEFCIKNDKLFILQTRPITTN